MEAKKLRVVWDGWHHNFEVISPPTCVDGELVVHVSTDSMKELLNADNPYEEEIDDAERYAVQGDA